MDVFRVLLCTQLWPQINKEASPVQDFFSEQRFQKNEYERILRKSSKEQKTASRHPFLEKIGRFAKRQYGLLKSLHLKKNCL